MNPTKFDLPKLKRLKRAYKAAVSHQKKLFIFDGNAYLTEYAKYLIEYLSARLTCIMGQHLKSS